ncbi:MAG: acyl-CoA desaturase [Candidatus Rokubacteria bacterium]|nr:acyl-CoA desaturase [Candidatus Rokubacteria bacterium]
MTPPQAVHGDPAAQPAHAAAAGRTLRFAHDTTFQLALRRRVDEYFQGLGRPPRDCGQMYLKTAILLIGFASSYGLLVFVAQTWAQGLFLAILLGLSAAGIGLNIQHDGGHQAYSKCPWVNRVMAMTLELIGGSSYLWRWKHVLFHHTYVNITDHDTDIDLGILARLAPNQKRLAFHRWQHLYLWPLYGWLALKWQLVDDFQKLIRGRISNQPFPRPKGWDLVVFVAGKALFFTAAFGIPLQVHTVGAVLCYYGIAGFTTGIVLSVVFQVAHCVEEAAFPVPRAGTRYIDRAWAIHQTETTVDFARRSRVITWLVGGLNFQIEHHLFPRISHVHYPAISKLVEETCRDFGVRYMAFPSFRAGVASHFRLLRRMGMPRAPQ